MHERAALLFENPPLSMFDDVCTEISEAPSRAPRWRITLATGGAVLLLHALALDRLLPAQAQPAVSRAAPLIVRSIEAPARLAPLDVSPRVVHATPLPRVRPLMFVKETETPVPTVTLVAATSPAAAASSEHAAALRPDVEIPIYRTQLPPPMRLAYDLRNGHLSGSGELIWRPAGHRYELTLEGSVAGLPVLTQTSSGTIDSTGISPERFLDKRLRRAMQAANFERHKRLISFSGSPHRYEWVPGTQDRLTWMLQLGAILAANPAKATAGQKITLYVAGARGEVGDWVFTFAGHEIVGNTRAAKFAREPRRPRDHHVEVWLDTERQHAPLRARQWDDSETDAFELLLRRSDPTP